LPGLIATRCETLASARAYLAGTAFDAVCTADELPDGSGLALLALRDGLKLDAPIFVRTTRHGAATAAAERYGGTACFDHKEDGEGADEFATEISRCLGVAGVEELAEEPEPAAVEMLDPRALVEALRSETGVVAHAINNPLTVIAGNAQFLLEMTRMMEVDP